MHAHQPPPPPPPTMVMPETGVRQRRSLTERPQRRDPHTGDQPTARHLPTRSRCPPQPTPRRRTPAVCKPQPFLIAAICEPDQFSSRRETAGTTRRNARRFYHPPPCDVPSHSGTAPLPQAERCSRLRYVSIPPSRERIVPLFPSSRLWMQSPYIDNRHARPPVHTHACRARRIDDSATDNW